MHLSSSIGRRASLALGLSSLALALAASATADTSVAVATMQTPAVLSGATVKSHMSGSTMISGSVSLTPANLAGLTAYAAGVSDPKSPLYHRFLTPAQVGQKFGASASTVNAVTTYLRGKGLTVTLVADSQTSILFRGRADKIETAFSTKLNNYSVPKRTDGPTNFYSFSSVPKVPKTIAPSVMSIGGLQTAYLPQRREPITPLQTRTLYGADTAYNQGNRGEGINVGITNFDGYKLSNATLFYNNFFATLGGTPNITKVSVDGGDGETVTAEGEADIDFQMVLSIAPRAHIYMYDTVNTGDLVACLTREANDNLVDIVTESYGHFTDESTRSYIAAAHVQHLVLTAQGITYLCASGDNGTNLGGYDYPDFDPELTIVGGTTGTVDGAGNRLTEVGWVGSGSGYSTFTIDFNVLPSFQVGTGVPTSINRRLFPDVAVRAWGVNKLFGDSQDGDGAYLVYEGGTLTRWQGGGTSAATPCFAGQLAGVLQQMTEQGIGDPTPSGRIRLGNLNSFIYDLNGDPSVFYDVVSGDSGPLANGGEAVATPGWDFVTGWGAPNAAGFFNAVAGGGSVPLISTAANAAVYQTTAPVVALGADVVGDASLLTLVDGSTYSLKTINQRGVGQVGGAEMTFQLQGTDNTRRSANLVLGLSSPTLTTDYIYVWNYQSNAYDVLKSLPGAGSMKTVSIPLDLSMYVSNSTAKVLVRSLKPTRLGSTPYRLSIDQAVVQERIAKS